MAGNKCASTLNFGSLEDRCSKLMTIDEVATLLRSSKKTIYRWVYERKIPFLKVHVKLLFEEDQISQFLASFRQDSSSKKVSTRDIRSLQSSESHHSRKGSLA